MPRDPRFDVGVDECALRQGHDNFIPSYPGHLPAEHEAGQFNRDLLSRCSFAVASRGRVPIAMAGGTGKAEKPRTGCGEEFSLRELRRPPSSFVFDGGAVATRAVGA